MTAPDDYTGLTLWLRGDDATPGDVSTWPDASGAGHDAYWPPEESTGGPMYPTTAPTCDTGVINGHQAVNFSRTATWPGDSDSSAWMSIPAGVITNDTAYTVLALINVDIPLTGDPDMSEFFSRSILLVVNWVDGDGIVTINDVLCAPVHPLSGGGFATYERYDESSFAQANDPAYTDNEWQLVIARLDVPNLLARVGCSAGVVDDTAATHTPSFTGSDAPDNTPAWMSLSYPVAQGILGYVAELIIYDEARTDPELTGLIKYFADTYGLDLPCGNPGGPPAAGTKLFVAAV